MEKISLHIYSMGSHPAPPDWRITMPVKMQRLYYIKSGIGWMIDDAGMRIPFEPGKVYLHPYNLLDRFVTDPDAPVDHIFFDFISTPPIISPSPIIYDVATHSSIFDMLTLIDRFLTERMKGETYYYRRGAVNGVARPSLMEQNQIMYNLLETLLMMLHFEKPLPFTSDAAVRETLEIIRQEYASPLTVSDLSTRAGFEQNYFIRRFKNVMGVTPYAYLRSYRLLKARELMAGGCTVARAAELVGYENASSLSRALAENTTKD
ncbi:MAG: helix-turn-helix transcriptional regulator [Ruminococcaceae bacterium]|nr:helix-turn-helix transcriptional regulator [Oscillospiraceae bacterium]